MSARMRALRYPDLDVQSGWDAADPALRVATRASILGDTV